MTIAPIGFDGSPIEVKCNATDGLHSLRIVGLDDKAIDKAEERVRSAIATPLLDYPKKSSPSNLAPAELPKDGAHYDVLIAPAVLCVSDQLQQKELGMDPSLPANQP